MHISSLEKEVIIELNTLGFDNAVYLLAIHLQLFWTSPSTEWIKKETEFLFTATGIQFRV